jgi:hypothetical protein
LGKTLKLFYKQLHYAKKEESELFLARGNFRLEKPKKIVTEECLLSPTIYTCLTCRQKIVQLCQNIEIYVKFRWGRKVDKKCKSLSYYM